MTCEKTPQQLNNNDSYQKTNPLLFKWVRWLISWLIKYFKDNSCNLKIAGKNYNLTSWDYYIISQLQKITSIEDVNIDKKNGEGINKIRRIKIETISDYILRELIKVETITDICALNGTADYRSIEKCVEFGINVTIGNIKYK